jgi:hypothetical protein
VRKLSVAWLAGVLACLVMLVVVLAVPRAKSSVRVVHGPAASAPVEIIAISNYAQQYISDAEIKNDIPAWERALNVDLAHYWYTTQYKLIFIGRQTAPPGVISAEFLAKGPIKGALAYHWVERGNKPSITVYAGTGDYYGFSNSVSMTHELEEMAVDPVTSAVNQGYPSDYYWLESKTLGIRAFLQTGVLGWFQEVSDPVEADSYTLPGANGKPVKISDFVTPAWFNDGVGDRYDFLGLCQQPFWIRPGGYAQYFDVYGWHQVLNFRTGHPADSGFAKNDPEGRS